LRPPREEARRHGAAHLRRERRHHGPRQAPRTGRGRRRRGVHAVAARPRRHRPVPGRQRRRMAPLERRTTRKAHRMASGRDSVGTVEDLHASARKVTGLDDFGDDDYLEGLEVLLASYAGEAGLTPLGNRAQRAMLRGALAPRQFSEAAWRRHPEHADVPVERPIFVTGLPRTGTTALHRLLTADPAHQGLDLWLAEVPQPRPPRETWADDPVFQAIDAGYRRHHVENPEFMGVHYISADSVEECWQLLR